MGFSRVWIHAIIPVCKGCVHAITFSLLDKGKFADFGFVGSGARSRGARETGGEEIGRPCPAVDLLAVVATVSATRSGNRRDGVGASDRRRFGRRRRLVSSRAKSIWL